MTYEEMQKQALAVNAKYNQLNKQNGGEAWDGRALMAGFVGDVGDLSKIIMAKHGLRSMENVDEKLAHELSDCLWSILVLADKYGIDMVSEFQKTMASLDERIDTQLQSA